MKGLLWLSSVVATASAADDAARDLVRHQRAAVDTFANPCFDDDSAEGRPPGADARAAGPVSISQVTLQAAADSNRRHERRGGRPRAHSAATPRPLPPRGPPPVGGAHLHERFLALSFPRPAMLT